MCHSSCIIFGAVNLKKEEIAGKRVIELGACEVNGSLRPLIESYGPAEYVGVDIVAGPGVDVVCPAEKVLEKFGPASFDIVITTEMLEHVRDWRTAISNIKNICRPNGIILITTRSIGFIYHAHPHDFWRYETSDLERIFADCQIEKLESDKMDPGVFLKARKPADFIETDLRPISLFSIIEGGRVAEVDENKLAAFHAKFERRQKIKQAYNRFYRCVKSWLS